jgi:radical SAM PhpK family P-methyltransferase
LSRLDCLVIGYKDEPLSTFAKRTRARSRPTPEAEIIGYSEIAVDGEALGYMEAISRYRRPTKGETPSRISPPEFHVGEVPNLAAVYLANYLRVRGQSAEFVTLFDQEWLRVQDILERESPRVIAITTTFYLNTSPVEEICSSLRACTDAYIVVGGPLIANLCRDLSDDALTAVFERIGADAFIYESQGERTLLELVRAVAGPHPATAVREVPNLHHRDGSGYSFTRTHPEENSLDECAIDWSSFSPGELGATVQTRTARSCAFKCAFCDYPVRAGALSTASMDVVEREMRQLASLGVKNIVFIDDTFNVPVTRFREFCNMMIRADLGVSWFSYFRCSNTPDDAIFDLAADSGCTGVFLGIESGDDEILTNMNKHARSSAYARGMYELQSRGIMTFASLIVGFPGETQGSVQRTIDFVNATSPDYFRAEPWWYSTASPIHQRRDEFGMTGSRFRWTHNTMNVDEACAGVAEVFRSVVRSTWLPVYSYDFWALPYLLGKGLSAAQLKSVHAKAQVLLTANRTPVDPSAASRDFIDTIQQLPLARPRFAGAGAAVS